MQDQMQDQMRDGDMTLFEVLEQCGAIITANVDRDMLFTARNTAYGTHYCALKRGAKDMFYVVDAWNTSFRVFQVTSHLANIVGRLVRYKLEEDANVAHDAKLAARKRAACY